MKNRGRNASVAGEEWPLTGETLGDGLNLRAIREKRNQKKDKSAREGPEKTQGYTGVV